MTVRRERAGDAAAIRRVHLEAFGQPDEAEIVDKIRASCADDTVSLVAMEAGRVVGHILFSPVQIEAPNGNVGGMGLGPMAVLPEYQSRGLGSALVRAGLSRLEHRRCPFVILVGHPGYYPRFGFGPASRRGIRCQWEVPDEAFLIRVLDETAVRGVRGVARYRPEFGAG